MEEEEEGEGKVDTGVLEVVEEKKNGVGRRSLMKRDEEMGTNAERSVAKNPGSRYCSSRSPHPHLTTGTAGVRRRGSLMIAVKSLHYSCSVRRIRAAQRGATSSLNYTSSSRLSALCSFMPNDSTVATFAPPLHGCLDASRLAATAAQLQRREERLTR